MINELVALKIKKMLIMCHAIRWFTSEKWKNSAFKNTDKRRGKKLSSIWWVPEAHPGVWIIGVSSLATSLSFSVSSFDLRGSFSLLKGAEKYNWNLAYLRRHLLQEIAIWWINMTNIPWDPPFFNVYTKIEIIKKVITL